MADEWRGETRSHHGTPPPPPALHIPLNYISLCSWQPTLLGGVDISLQVYATERRLCLELHATTLGRLRVVVDFGDVSTLTVTEAEHLGQNICTIDMKLQRIPTCYRGTSHSSTQDITWVPEPFPPAMWLSPMQQPTRDAEPRLVLCSRSDLLVAPLHFLLEMDPGIKSAYQAGYHRQQQTYQFMSHNYATSSQIARQSMENLSNLMSSSGGAYHPNSTAPPTAANGALSSGDEKSSARFKPTEFCAKMLKIGAWSKKSYCSGDLKCKFLYVKKRIVWEVIDVVGLIKIELCFKDIASISMQQSNDGVVLFVEIAKLPFFYRGYLQKMKNTRWEHTGDMTGGQASLSRTHELHFARGVLEPHLERLIQSSTHIKQVTNVTPQMLAGFRAHRQTAATTIFTSVVPPIHGTHPLGGSGAFSFVGPTAFDGAASGPERDNFTHLAATSTGSSTACGCSEPAHCATKQCHCVKSGVWCGANCSCQAGADCGNPVNQHMTPCMKQNLVAVPPPNSRLNVELDTIVKLPCRCNSVAIRQLLSQHSCAECGLQYYYSLCFQSVVSADAIWHCGGCGVCRDFREAHCDQCNTCTFVDSRGGCQLCGGADPDPDHDHDHDPEEDDEAEGNDEGDDDSDGHADGAEAEDHHNASEGSARAADCVIC